MVRRRRIRPASALESLSPLWILSQIVILQVTYYLFATLLLLFTTLVQGSQFTFDVTFSWRSLRADNTVGWMLGLVWLANSLTNVVAITLLIGRSKYVLDFSLTIHFIHLIITSLYSHSLPLSWLWWAVQIGSSICTIILSTWLCQKREMQPLSWAKGTGSRVATVNSRVDESHEMLPLKQGQDIP